MQGFWLLLVCFGVGFGFGGFWLAKYEKRCHAVFPKRTHRLMHFMVAPRFFQLFVCVHGSDTLSIALLGGLKENPASHKSF